MNDAAGFVVRYGGWKQDDPREFISVTVWSGMDAVGNFAGVSGRPVLFGDARDLVESMTVEQFELED